MTVVYAPNIAKIDSGINSEGSQMENFSLIQILLASDDLKCTLIKNGLVPIAKIFQLESYVFALHPKLFASILVKLYQRCIIDFLEIKIL